MAVKRKDVEGFMNSDHGTPEHDECCSVTDPCTAACVCQQCIRVLDPKELK